MIMMTLQANLTQNQNVLEAFYSWKDRGNSGNRKLKEKTYFMKAMRIKKTFGWFMKFRKGLLLPCSSQYTGPVPVTGSHNRKASQKNQTTRT